MAFQRETAALDIGSSFGVGHNLYLAEKANGSATSKVALSNLRVILSTLPCPEHFHSNSADKKPL